MLLSGLNDAVHAFFYAVACSMVKVDLIRFSSFDSCFQTFVLSHSTTMQYNRLFTTVAESRNRSSMNHANKREVRESNTKVRCEFL